MQLTAKTHAAPGLLAVAVLLAGCGAGDSEVDATARVTSSSPPAASPPPESSSPSASSAEERIARSIYRRVDDERQERGLEPLAWDDALATVADEWSAQMASTDDLQHQDLTDLLRDISGFRALGENIYTATRPVPAGAIHVGWMESPHHRTNILNEGFDAVGIGVHCADDDSVWATQEFGRTTDAEVPPVDDETPPRQPVVRSAEDGPRCG